MGGEHTMQNLCERQSEECCRSEVYCSLSAFKGLRSRKVHTIRVMFYKMIDRFCFPQGLGIQQAVP